jgi:hypothetical protein
MGKEIVGPSRPSGVIEPLKSPSKSRTNTWGILNVSQRERPHHSICLELPRSAFEKEILRFFGANSLKMERGYHSATGHRARSLRQNRAGFCNYAFNQISPPIAL